MKPTEAKAELTRVELRMAVLNDLLQNDEVDMLEVSTLCREILGVVTTLPLKTFAVATTNAMRNMVFDHVLKLSEPGDAE